MPQRLVSVRRPSQIAGSKRHFLSNDIRLYEFMLFTNKDVSLGPYEGPIQIRVTLP